MLEGLTVLNEKLTALSMKGVAGLEAKDLDIAFGPIPAFPPQFSFLAQLIERLRTLDGQLFGLASGQFTPLSEHLTANFDLPAVSQPVLGFWSAFGGEVADATFVNPTTYRPVDSTHPITDTKNRHHTPTDIQRLVFAMAQRYGVDPFLALAVAKAESNFNPDVVSPKGAVGVMQLMPETAKALGVSNPFDPIQNIDGGIRYLKQLIERFGGNVPLAVAAYNAGPNAVRRYGVVPPYPETQNFVRRVFAYRDAFLKDLPGEFQRISVNYSALMSKVSSNGSNVGEKLSMPQNSGSPAAGDQDPRSQNGFAPQTVKPAVGQPLRGGVLSPIKNHSVTFERHFNTVVPSEPKEGFATAMFSQGTQVTKNQTTTPLTADRTDLPQGFRSRPLSKGDQSADGNRNGVEVREQVVPPDRASVFKTPGLSDTRTANQNLQQGESVKVPPEVVSGEPLHSRQVVHSVVHRLTIDVPISEGGERVKLQVSLPTGAMETASVQVSVKVSDEQLASQLSQHLPTLRQQLLELGIVLAQWTVVTDGRGGGRQDPAENFGNWRRLPSASSDRLPANSYLEDGIWA
ncbi:MAG: transglycosylase SLT domain-containing protein [Candidatus Fervidibacter sp.]|uniref:transglycosylase SLT domain-containing protein n=1 Tax=Candidatus Fervidibacter sp. TaxID=3100871 RepID=UPI00404A8CDB